MIEQFNQEVICNYREETYSVRDNGAILRHPKNEGRRRPLDEQWTFGKINKQKGYLQIASTPVHRIVAAAYLDPQPTKGHVIDHIDTNRQNNRPENLRWVTRLENILHNPITRRRIELAYGSVDNFLSDPSKPIVSLPPNYEWMRTVTKEEADSSRLRLLEWAKSDKTPSGNIRGGWIISNHNSRNIQDEPKDSVHSGLVESKTIHAIQKNWKTPTEFPLCPSTTKENSLVEYFGRLANGESFSRNEYEESRVFQFDYVENLGKLVVLGHHPDGAIKQWSVVSVTLEDGLFIHENVGMFFDYEGAEKYYTLERGLDWDGEDTFDDLVR